MSTAILITCLADNFFPEVGNAMVEILKKLNRKIYFPDKQTCCGQPMFNNGLVSDAKSMAASFIEIFEPFEEVVTPSGSCASMVRNHYPELFKDDPEMQKRACRLAGKTFEFIEFLIKKTDLNPADVNLSGETVTFHYSCHLKGILTPLEIESFIKKIKDIEYRQLNDMTRCCGFGGTFSLMFSKLSNKITHEKVQNIISTKTGTVIVNDSGCARKISSGLKKENSKVKVKSLTQLLAGAD